MTAELKLVTNTILYDANELRVGGVYRGNLYRATEPQTFVIGERLLGDIYGAGSDYHRIYGMKIASAFIDNAGLISRGSFAKFKEDDTHPKSSFAQVGTVLENKDHADLCGLLPGSLAIVRTPHAYNDTTRQAVIGAIGLTNDLTVQLRFGYGKKYYTLPEIELEVLHPERGVMKFVDGALVVPQQG